MAKRMSPAAAALSMIASAGAIETGLEELMDLAAKIVQDEARSMVGHYQTNIAPFEDWAPLAESTEAEKAQLGYAMGAPLLREGDLKESIQRAATAFEAVVGSNDPFILYHEEGTIREPPRSLLGAAAVKKETEVATLIIAGYIVAISAQDRARHLFRSMIHEAKLPSEAFGTARRAFSVASLDNVVRILLRRAGQ